MHLCSATGADEGTPKQADPRDNKKVYQNEKVRYNDKVLLSAEDFREGLKNSFNIFLCVGFS